MAGWTFAWEGQIEVFLSLYGHVLDDVESVFLQVTQTVGEVGTGKTCTAVNFGKRIEKEAFRLSISLKHVYVNAKVEGGQRHRCLYKLSPNEEWKMESTNIPQGS